MAVAGILIYWLRPNKQLAIGVLYSSAWIAALLPWFDLIAQQMGFWSYRNTDGPTLGQIPLALYLGWVVSWGIVAPLLSEALGKRIWHAAAVMILIDLRAMPEMTPLLTLSKHWWIGETLISAVLLVPAMLLSHWTSLSAKTALRCAMLAPAFGGVFIGIPFLIECHDLTSIRLLWESWSRTEQILFPLGIFIFSIPGLTALRDLALSGKGTPIPLEPPRYLVTHGIYAYIQNPMQLSMTCLLLLESWLLTSPWPALLALIGIVYSTGFARWSENRDMHQRFGATWQQYLSSHRPWLPSWIPVTPISCQIWFDDSCGMCQEIARWLERRSPVGLEFCYASAWTGPPLRRVTWIDPQSGRIETGISAMAMAFQHIHLGWALLGWFAAIPGISHILQICFDAAGAGKKEPNCRNS
jgi:protein-S-isoprenylcysteine O-methyltransferase Ste14/predicted DCC family thiol-disulfide oxidoreductase YuxK